MATQKFKYNINHQISLQPRDVSIAAIEKILLNDYGISRDKFYKDRSTLVDDDFSIPSDRMEVYAGLFGCTVDELKNFTTKKIKPLHERKLSPSEKSIVKKAKLSK